LFVFEKLSDFPKCAGRGKRDGDDKFCGRGKSAHFRLPGIITYLEFCGTVTAGTTSYCNKGHRRLESDSEVQLGVPNPPQDRSVACTLEGISAE
jgi:hypothetical protein